MHMAKPLIIANWKMNPDSSGRAAALARRIESGIAGIRGVDVVVAPPFPFLGAVRAALKKARLGAQDAFWVAKGAYTGEVSAHQLKYFRVGYVIVGHSERRGFLGETDEMVQKKLRAVIEAGMIAILCVGERERAGDDIPAVVGEQLERAVAGMEKRDLERIAVAYEPVWALSSTPGSRPDTPEGAHRAMLSIRKILASRWGRSAAEKVRILYGGSVSASNAASFLVEGRMQGLLVGGASLRPREFAEIVRSAGK